MLIRLVEFFSTPLGTNYHSFAIQLTLSITLFSYLYLSIKSHSIPSPVALWAMVLVTFVQIILGGIGQINLGIPFYGPSLDRALILLQILWVFPALNPSKQPLRQGAIYSLGSILIGGFAIST